MHRFPRGRVPFEGKCFLVLEVDIQNTYLPWAVYAIGPKDHALVDHGNASTADDIVDITERIYHRGEEKIPIRMAVIDTGHRTKEAYDLCRIIGRKMVCVPVKGSTGITQADPLRAQRIGAYPDGKPLPANESIVLRHVHPRFFHDVAWAMLEPLESKDGDTLIDVWAKRKTRINFHEEIDREFVNQITAEVLRETEPDKRGRTKLEVHVIRKNNHQFDCFRYSLVARYLLEEDLKEPEKKPEPEEDKKAPHPPPAGTITLETLTL